MRVLAIACAVAAFGQDARARDVALILNWPDTGLGAEFGSDAPADAPGTAEVVAVTRDASGAVLTLVRQALKTRTPEVTLALPSLSRQATTLHVGALVDGEFHLASARAAIDGGQPPNRLTLHAVLTASFTTDYFCDKVGVVSLVPDGAGFMMHGARNLGFAPTGLEGRFEADNGTVVNRIPGLLQLESADGALLDTCQPIPARPILPLTALGPQDDRPWRVDTGLDGSVLQLPTDYAENTPPDAPAPQLATSIRPQGDDAMLFDMGVHRLLIRHAPCALPGVDMPFPLRASLTGPEGTLPMGCAGDPLRSLEGAPWQVTHLFGVPVPRADEGASALTMQVDTGRVAGRTSCNRYLGRTTVLGGQLELRDLGATRLLCPINLTNLETRFLDALEAATGIRHLPDGGLALYAGPTAVLVAGR